MNAPFPSTVEEIARRNDVHPALAFGLGEGLNLFYVRREEGLPFRFHVLPGGFEERIAMRKDEPRAAAIEAALVGNAHGVMLCTGDPHGLDAIEAWAEELPRWPLRAGWEESVRAVTEGIVASDGLYRRSYGVFLDEAARYHAGLEAPRALLDEIADGWLDVAARLERGGPLERVAPRLLRMAALESRFWGLILDRFEAVF